MNKSYIEEDKQEEANMKFDKTYDEIFIKGCGSYKLRKRKLPIEFEATYEEIFVFLCRYILPMEFEATCERIHFVLCAGIKAGH